MTFLNPTYQFTFVCPHVSISRWNFFKNVLLPQHSYCKLEDAFRMTNLEKPQDDNKHMRIAIVCRR